MKRFFDRLVEFRPEVIYGYPSAIGSFCDFMTQSGLSCPPARVVIATAEHLSDRLRSKIQHAFSAEVFNLYCTREYGCIAFECSAHEGMHIDVGNLHLETIREGKPAQPGMPGEIAITDFSNFGMPFIRSLTGDVGTLTYSPCKCGSHWPRLLRLDGRSTEFIRFADGHTIPGLLLTDLLSDITGIRSAQYIQHRIDALEVRIEYDGQPTSELIRTVRSEVRQMIGNGIEIEVVPVATIPRNPHSGKYSEVVSMVHKDLSENE